MKKLMLFGTAVAFSAGTLFAQQAGAAKQESKAQTTKEATAADPAAKQEAKPKTAAKTDTAKKEAKKPVKKVPTAKSEKPEKKEAATPKAEEKK
jgi:hypothetical protein